MSAPSLPIPLLIRYYAGRHFDIRWGYIMILIGYFSWNTSSEQKAALHTSSLNIICSPWASTAGQHHYVILVHSYPWVLILEPSFKNIGPKKARKAHVVSFSLSKEVLQKSYSGSSNVGYSRHTPIIFKTCSSGNFSYFFRSSWYVLRQPLPANIFLRTILV